MMDSKTIKTTIGSLPDDDHDLRSRRCQVSYHDFPLLDHCYQKISGGRGLEEQSCCKHCLIWTSPPDTASLMVATWFECKWFQYTKRLKG